MNLLVPLIKEFVIDSHCDFISGLKEIGIVKDGRIIFTFYITRYITGSDMSWLLNSVREQLIVVFKLVGMYSEYSNLFFYIELDHTLIKKS